jgi:predicted RNA-binding Zn ribbon-like protein
MARNVDQAGQQLLLDLLNTTPVVNGASQDLLGGDDQAGEWALARGGTGTSVEAEQLRLARDRLRAVVVGAAPVSALAPLLSEVRLRPAVGEAGIDWQLEVADERRLATRAVLAWAKLHEEMPGRLRPCANTECRLFLIDRSRANAARWCSMKICGNRMKARRHYRRSREDLTGPRAGLPSGPAR